MDDLEQEWMNFIEYNDLRLLILQMIYCRYVCSITPECSDIYISTKTKICY